MSHLIAPPPPDHLVEFFDTRRGPGKGVTAGYGVGVEEITITDPAKLPAVLAATANKRISFDPKCASIGKHTKYQAVGPTFIDGTGWAGAIIGAIDTSNCPQAIGLNLSITQPFVYGRNPAGFCATSSNVPRSYQKNCSWWDTGDACIAGGGYQLTPGGKGDQKPPFLSTVDSCRIGPNPGEYAMMAPSKGAKPGHLNGIDNDPRNGKGGNVAVDHQQGSTNQPMTALEHTAWSMFVDCVFQGCQIRNGKTRDQYLALVSCLIAKYGTPFDLGGPSIHHGAGSAVDDAGVLDVLGCVYLPYENGEQVVGFQDAIADRHKVPRIRVTDAAGNTAINCEGTAHRDGNVRVWGTYLAGQSIDLPRTTTGWDLSAYYSAPIADASSYAAARALVHRLEDVAATRAGNPWSTLQPPCWRDVHTGPSFPAAA